MQILRLIYLPNSTYHTGFSCHVIKERIDGNIFHLVTAKVFSYSFKALQEIYPNFRYIYIYKGWFTMYLSNFAIMHVPVSGSNRLYQARGIKFHQSLFSTGLIHTKNNKQLLLLPICNDEIIFLLIIYSGMLMKSSPMYEQFVCTDWHHTSKKCQYSITWNSKAFCIIINGHGTGCRSESVLSHPVSVPRNAQKMADESPVSSLPPWLKARIRNLTEITKSSTRGCQTVVSTNLLIIQAINLEVKGSLPYEQISELFTAQRLLVSVNCVENTVT